MKAETQELWDQIKSKYLELTKAGYSREYILSEICRDTGFHPNTIMNRIRHVKMKRRAGITIKV